MKPGIAVLGIDDGSFDLYEDEIVPVIGVVQKGKIVIEGVLETIIEIDDEDVSTKIISMILQSKHYEQLQAIIHMGLTIGGFGILDLPRISSELDIPIICLSRSERGPARIKNALSKLEDGQERIEVVSNAGPPFEHCEYDLYLQYSGCSRNDAEEIVSNSIKTGNIPESVRMADMIANSVSRLIKQLR